MTWGDLGFSKRGVWFTFTFPFTLIFIIPNLVLACLDKRDVFYRSIEWTHAFLPGHRWKPLMKRHRQCVFCFAVRPISKEVK